MPPGAADRIRVESDQSVRDREIDDKDERDRDHRDDKLFKRVDKARERGPRINPHMVVPLGRLFDHIDKHHERIRDKGHSEFDYPLNDKKGHEKIA